MMMPEREKVIKGLECCMSEQICKGCPYKEMNECEDRGYYYSKAIEDAIALLKEQGALEERHKALVDAADDLLAKLKEANQRICELLCEKDKQASCIYDDGQ